MNEGQNNIENARNIVINIALVAVCFLILLSDIFSFIRAQKYGLWIVFIIQTSVTILLIATTIYRYRISLKIKVVVIFLVLLTLILSGLLGIGFLTSAKYHLVIIPVIISFLVSYRKAIISIIILFIAYAVFAFLYTTGLLDYTLDLYAYTKSLNTWILDYVVIFAASFSLLYISNYFGKTLTENYGKIEHQNKELTEQEKKYRTLFESSNDAIILINDNRLIDFNSKTLELFNCDKEYLIGKKPHELSAEIQPDGQTSQTKSIILFNKVLQGEPQIFDWQHVKSNGEYFDASVSLNLIHIENKKYIQAVLRDITEKKKIEIELVKHRNNLENMVAEQTSEIASKNEQLQLTLNQLKDAQSQLVQSEKMASLGVLTAGMSHELNNPLNYIMGGYVGLENYFIEKNEQNDEINILLNSIKVGIERATNIINGLNQFSRDSNNLIEICDIHSIIENCLVMLNNKLSKKIEVKKSFCSKKINVYGNLGKLHQVFIHILTNAVQAIENEGQIEIKTAFINQTVLIEITDNGHGISQENLNRVFDPFFTTKDPGIGTGLGLSIAYSIIQDHKGRIEIQSELNKGSTVKITLPNV